MASTEIRYDTNTAMFGVVNAPVDMHRNLQFDHGFDPLQGSPGVFVCRHPALVAPFYDLCTDEVKRIVYPYALNYHNSFTLGPVSQVWGNGTPAPADRAYIAPEAQTYPFQVGGVQLLQARRFNLLGDEAGGGKTVTSLSVLNNQSQYPRIATPGQPCIKEARHLRVLVTCPAFLVSNWVEEIGRWYRAERLPVTALDKAKPVLPSYGFYVLPDSRAASHFNLLTQSGTFDFMISDEIHRSKAADTKRAIAIFGDGFRQPGLINWCARGVAMSGTPIPNNPGELFNLLRAYAPDCLEGRSRDPFTERYTDQDERGRIVGAKREAALNALLRGSGLMTRRLKVDFLPQLPPKRISLVQMPMHGDIAALVREETELFELAQMKAYRTAAELADLVGHIMTVRKRLALAKAPMIAEYVLYQFDTNERESGRLVLFMLHTEAIDLIAERCAAKRIRVFVVDGRTPLKRRHEMVKAFQLPDKTPTLFLGQIKAAGVGLTLTRARRAGMGELSWSFADNTQAMDRIHRIGQTGEVDIDVLTVAHAVESRVIIAAARKELSAGRMLDERITAAILEAEDAIAPDMETEDDSE